MAIRIDRQLADELKERKLVLEERREGRTPVIHVCLDGSHGRYSGMSIGYVHPGADGLWVAYGRNPNRSTSQHSELSQWEPNVLKAIDTVIGGQGAHYGDILEAVEAETGRRATYTVHFSSVEIGEWFGMLSDPRGMNHLGGGSVRFTNTAVAYYRSLSKWSGVYVQGDVIYYDGQPYRLIPD